MCKWIELRASFSLGFSLCMNKDFKMRRLVGNLVLPITLKLSIETGTPHDNVCCLILEWGGTVKRDPVRKLLLVVVQRAVQPRPKYSYSILLKGSKRLWRACAGFLFVGYWITHCVPCLGCFLVFIVCPPHSAINIWHHMRCYLPNICNYIMITASLERVQFEFLQSFPLV